MPQLFDRSSGSWVDVRPEEARTALRSGRYSMEPPTQDEDPGFVGMTGSDGSPLRVPEDQIDALLASGATLETDRQEAARRQAELFGDRPLETAVTGLASGATLGLSDVAIAALGGDEAAVALGALREENPLVSGVSQIAGAVAPTLLTGGGSVAAQGGAKGAAAMVAQGASSAARGVGVLPRGVAALGLGAERAVLGASTSITRKALAKAAGGAVEGAAFGAGSLASELALSDDPVLTADKVISHVGMGALIGGAAGGAFSVAEDAVRAGIGVASSKVGSLRERITELRRDAALSATNARPSKLAKAQERRQANEIADFLSGNLDELDGKKIIEAGDSATQITQKLERAMDVSGKAKTRLVKEIDEAFPGATVSVEALQKRLREEMSESIFDSSGAVLPLKEKDFKKLNKAIDSLKRYGDETGSIGIKQGDDLVRNLQKAARKAYEKIPANRTFTDDLIMAQARIARAEVDDTIVRVAQNAPEQKLAEQYLRSKTTYSQAAEAQKLVADGAGRIGNNNTFSLLDTMSGQTGFTAGAILGGLPGAIGGAAIGLGRKAIRERGDSFRLALFKTMEDASARSNKRMEGALSKLFAGAKGRAARAGRVTAKVGYRTAKEGAKSAAADAAKQSPVQRIIPASANQFLRMLNGDTSERPKTLSDQIKQLSMISPQQAAERAQSTMAGSMDLEPAMAGAITQRAMAATAFLQSKIPRNPKVGQGLMAGEWNISRLEQRKFQRYLDAVDDPLSVVEDVAGGRLNREGVEVLKNVYPNLHQDLVDKIQQRIETAKEPPLRTRRAALSLLLGQPFDAGFTAKHIAFIQSTYQNQPQHSQGAVASGGGMSVAKDHQTAAQGLLEG